MHLRHILAALVALGSVIAATATASPLRLSYATTAQPGNLYHYDFNLTLTNLDGSWHAGQGWDWIVFGDEPGKLSPLQSWVGGSVGLPFKSWTYSGGWHNGPTLAPITVLWTPQTIGDSLAWSGTANVDLGPGALLFSTLLGGGAAHLADFETAVDLDPPRRLPEPSQLALFGAALLALGLGRRLRPGR
jgi:hypothetical protein